MLAIVKTGTSTAYVHYGYGRLSVVKMVSLLNGGELSYLDWHDIADRAWKKGCRQKNGRWIMPKPGRR
jgi:hypothetical protein